MNEQGPSLEKDVRRLFREELIGAGAEKAINERLGKIELDLLARKGREDAAKITTEQRLAARLSQSLLAQTRLVHKPSSSAMVI